MPTFTLRLLRILVILSIPALIFLGVTRLLVEELYLTYEYGKADFPEDPAGFDRIQRQAYAKTMVGYILQNQPVAVLQDLDLNGVSLDAAREIKLLQQVQHIFQSTRRVGQISLFLFIISSISLTWRKVNRAKLFSSLRTGGALTVGLAILTGLFAILAWQTWFSFFHQVFFSLGNWSPTFPNVLMRIFPGKLWYDATITVSNLSLIAGALVYFLGTLLPKIHVHKGSKNDNTHKIYPGLAL